MEQKLNHKLAIIQTELKVKKSQFNSFGKYYFRRAEDILEALKPFLVTYGVSVRLKEKLVGENIIKSSAIISDGLESIKATALVGIETNQKGMQMPQKFGAASSYGKKYALGNLFLIDDTKDSDATNNHNKTSGILKPVKKELTKDQIPTAIDYLNDGNTIEGLKKYYTITNEVETSLLNQIK
jgi:hypothetical protein